MSQRMGPRRWIALARERVEQEMGGHGGGMFARGLSSEGYNGGYRDALDDVALLLNGVKPHRRNWYDEPERASKGGAR